MHVPPSFHTDLRDILFADWAELVTFIEVSTTYDPQQGEVAESRTETDVLAVIGPGLSTPEPNTAHQHTQLTRSFLIRGEDLPENVSLSSSRIGCHGQEFAVLTVDYAPQTNLMVVQTVLRE